MGVDEAGSRGLALAQPLEHNPLAIEVGTEGRQRVLVEGRLAVARIADQERVPVDEQRLVATSSGATPTASGCPVSDQPGDCSTANIDAVGPSRLVSRSSSGCMPVSKTTGPSGCSIRNAPTGKCIVPVWPLSIVPVSVVSQPHSRGRMASRSMTGA